MKIKPKTATSKNQQNPRGSQRQTQPTVNSQGIHTVQSYQLTLYGTEDDRILDQKSKYRTAKSTKSNKAAVRDNNKLLEDYLITYNLRDRMFQSSSAKEKLRRKKFNRKLRQKKSSLPSNSNNFNYSRFHNSRLHRSIESGFDNLNISRNFIFKRERRKRVQSGYLGLKSGSSNNNLNLLENGT